MAEILIIEDDPILAYELAGALERSGHHVRVTSLASDGLAQARAALPDIVLLDLRLPDDSGHSVLKKLQKEDPSLPVVMVSGYGSLSDAVDAMRKGASDYLQKPLDFDEVELLIARLLREQRERRELDYLRERSSGGQEAIHGRDPRILQIFSQVRRVAAAGLSPGDRPTILLTGETGTGKGMVARAIHQLLGGGPFIEVNCAAMPAGLIEAELFGHDRGAFTGAARSRPGLFEAAEGGMLFLDEIGELDLPLQSKLLGAIEGRRTRRLGSTQDRPLDLQIVAATNRDLDAAAEVGIFRADLLHRLRVLSWVLPPLRERKEDLGEIADHFVTTLGARYGITGAELTPEARSLLAQYPWPGNVRELRNVIERAVLVRPGSRLDVDAFSLSPQEMETGAISCEPIAQSGDPTSTDLNAMERELIQAALAKAGGNQAKAARQLGVSRYALRYRLKKWGIE